MLDADAAFIAGLDFFDIIFKATQRGIFTFKHHYTVPQEAQVLTAFDFAVRYITAGNIANFGDLKNFANFCRTQYLFLKCGCHHSGHRAFDIFDDIIDDAVKAHVHVFLAC